MLELLWHRDELWGLCDGVCLPRTRKGERATARDEDPLPRAALSPSWEATDLKTWKNKRSLRHTSYFFCLHLVAHSIN